MKGNHIGKKSLVVGIILLFLGTSILPSTGDFTVSNEIKKVNHGVWYAFSTYPGDNSVWFDPANPGVQNYIGPNTASSFISGGSWIASQTPPWYVTAYYGGIYTVDPATGAMTLIGGSTQLNGLGYSDVTDTLYGAGSYTLYKVDMTTGATTTVGNFNTGGLMIEMAIDANGNAYGLDAATDSICSIDLTTGAATLIGPTGIYDDSQSGMGFDKDNNVLYLTGGHLYTVNVTTGHATPISDFQGHEVDGLAIPYGNPNQDPCASFTWEPSHPYTDQTILFNASRSFDPDGSITLYEWDWDNDGIYDESTPSPFTIHSWSISGRYLVRLRVTGSDAATDIVSKTVTVLEPLNPPTIEGPHYGKINTTYTFSLGTITDPDGDQFYCLWDWGDEQSGWLGPFDSGGAVSASHSWSKPGNYIIKVKLKDVDGSESDWSAPFPITIVQLKNAFFLGIFESINQTDDLMILQVGPFMVLPSNQIFYSGKTIVISKEYLGFIGTIGTLGVGGVAIP